MNQPKRIKDTLNATAATLGRVLTRTTQGAGQTLQKAARTPIAKAAMLPLMATTMLAGDGVQERPLLAQQPWSHGEITAAGFGFTSSGTRTNEGAQVLPSRCYTPRRTEPAPLFNRDESSWRGFYNMANGGAFARDLHQVALSLDLAICETTDADHVRNFDGSTRVAGISADSDLDTNIREAAHGIVHALMQRHNLSTPAADEALFSRLNRHLTAEAVAMVAEYVIAAEMAANGDATLLRNLRQQNAPGFAHFDAALTAERRGGNTQTAIARAASSTINHIVRQPAFIAANSDGILRAYIGQLTDERRPRRSSEFGEGDARRMGQIGRSSIADGVQLLTPAELASISPQIASMVETMQSLHATHNRYTAPRTYVSGNTYARVTIDGLQQQMDNSNGVYTAAQAFERARTARDYTYAGRSWQLRETFTAGVQGDYSFTQTPVSAQPIWQQLDAMRRLSPTFGPAMADIATQTNVVMCYGPLNATLLGEWQPNNGLIVLNGSYRDMQANTRTLAHELLHMMQNHYGISNFNTSSTIADLQMSSLARESAASVISVLVAMEFKLYGDDRLWAFGDDQPRADRMLQVYTETRAGGASHQQSLEAAGHEGFTLMFQRQWWLDSYNNGTAREMIGRLASGWFRAPGNNRYPLAHIQRAGQTSDSFNFTRNVDAIPDDQMIFGTNDSMRQLYDYIHLQHLVRTRGERHPDTRAQRASMQAESNPYINVDFNELAARVAANRDQTVLSHINCMVNGTCAELRPPPPPERQPSCGV